MYFLNTRLCLYYSIFILNLVLISLFLNFSTHYRENFTVLPIFIASNNHILSQIYPSGFYKDFEGLTNHGKCYLECFFEFKLYLH